MTDKQPTNCPDCSTCQGIPHHFGNGQYLGFADDGDRPEHPAARAGEVFWYNCKHCNAWAPICDQCELVPGAIWNGVCQECETPVPLSAYAIGPDTVVACSPGDALLVLSAARHGEPDFDGIGDIYDEVIKLDDGEIISIFCDGAGQISDGGTTVLLTAREWCAREGRGALCSTDF